MPTPDPAAVDAAIEHAKNRSRPNMDSACDEYACPCHYQIGVLANACEHYRQQLAAVTARAERLRAELERWRDLYGTDEPSDGVIGSAAGKIVAERNREIAAYREVLSGLSLYLSAGMGDDSTTAKDYDSRIRWGIDNIVRIEAERRAHLEAQLAAATARAEWSEATVTHSLTAEVVDRIVKNHRRWAAYARILAKAHGEALKREYTEQAAEMERDAAALSANQEGNADGN